MLKIVVYDSGYGGELFADRLAEALPVVEIIRVIDWRHASQIQSSAKAARKFAVVALRPYIGKVDLIIFANHLLSITSLKFFRRRYKNQQFIGFNLKLPDKIMHRGTIMLTTRPIMHTFNYHYYLFRTKRRVRSLALDAWPAKIDDGELSPSEICKSITNFAQHAKIKPKEIILAHANFSDLVPELRNLFSRNLKIYDSFNDTIIATCKTLKIRGGTGKKLKN